MTVPPPMRDPVHIETRLLVVAEMLERAVEEVRRAMEEIKRGGGGHSLTIQPAPDDHPTGSTE